MSEAVALGRNCSSIPSVGASSLGGWAFACLLQAIPQGVGGGMGNSAGSSFGIRAIQYCWQGTREVQVRPSGSLLRDTDMLTPSLGVAGGANCTVSSLCDAFPRSFNGH